MDKKGHTIDPKGLKMMLFALNKVKNGPKGLYHGPKWAKMHKKRQKIEFLDLKNLLFSGIFLSGIRGYPLPPLTEKSAK